MVSFIENFTDKSHSFIKEEIKDKIAVIGISAKIPKYENYMEFWNGLICKENSITEIEESRKKDCIDYIQKTNPSLNVDFQKMGFIKLDCFDYHFFKVPYKDATLMDPRQRIFLEESTNALIDAGYPENLIRGKNVGVYVGASNSDTVYTYDRLIFDSQIKNPSAVVFNLPSMIASRTSYQMDLKGPSLAIDTSCSSSLVAIHQACQALLNRECDMAIAGGCSINLIPLNYNVKLGIESESFQTRAFDDEADGTAFGEGVVTVVLKPLRNALKDQDQIYAVVESSMVSNHGTSIGLASPSVDGESSLIYENLVKSKISAEKMNFIEAHGTGTAIGDVIEIESIKRAYEKFTDKKQFCAIGSVKNNIGHLLSSSGAASFVKAALSIKNGMIPPVSNFETPNRRIKFESSPVYINLDEVELDLSQPIYGSVNSFGMSGTNCNIILSSHPQNQSSGNQPSVSDGNSYLFTLSAKTEGSLRASVASYITWFEKDLDYSLSDISYTMNVRRNHYKHRVAFLAHSFSEFYDKLKITLSNLDENLKTENVYISETLEERPYWNAATIDYSREKGSLEKICEAYIKGAPIEWRRLFQNTEKVVSLPGYSFQKTRCWYSDELKDFSILEDVKKFNEEELLVIEEWAKLFGLREIELSQNVYDVGGDSLTLVTLFHEVANKISNLVLEEFIEFETLEEILQYVRSKKENLDRKVKYTSIYLKEDIEVYKISQGINNSNSYLIKDKNNVVLIDAGVRLEDLIMVFEEIKLKRIDYMILTHGHYDHIYSAEEIKRTFGSRNVIHRKEGEFAQDWVNNGMVLVGKEFQISESDCLVEDGEILHVGDLSFTMISTPGHTEGSMCIRMNDLLFTGDTLFKDKAAGVDQKTGDEGKLRKSVAAIIELMPSELILCPGHGDIVSLSELRNLHFQKS